MWAVTGVGRKLFENILLLGAFFFKVSIYFFNYQEFQTRQNGIRQLIQ